MFCKLLSYITTRSLFIGTVQTYAGKLCPILVKNIDISTLIFLHYTEYTGKCRMPAQDAVSFSFKTQGLVSLEFRNFFVFWSRTPI